MPLQKPVPAGTEERFPNRQMTPLLQGKMEGTGATCARLDAGSCWLHPGREESIYGGMHSHIVIRKQTESTHLSGPGNGTAPEPLKVLACGSPVRNFSNFSDSRSVRWWRTVARSSSPGAIAARSFVQNKYRKPVISNG